MKKILLIIALALLPAMMSAQGFHSYVDLFAGTGIMSGGKSFEYGENSFRDIRTDLAFGLNITEGYQINKMFFAGVGFGGYATMMGWKSLYNEGYGSSDCDDNAINSIYLPLYADFRWTLNMESKVTPFVDIKVGYQFGVHLGTGDMSWNGDVVYERCKSGFYFLPSVGVRFGKAAGFNLGIAYNPSIGMNYERVSEKDPLEDHIVIKSFNYGVLMLTLGADF